MLITNGNRTSDKFTATPEKYPQKRFNPKPCKWCSAIFEPIAPSHLHCSDFCADKSAEKRYFMSNYGVSSEVVYQMLDSQDRKCKICGGEGFRMKAGATNKLVLDHDHKTGDVRGMLCHNCNRGLGLFQDSIDHLQSAIEYLEGATTISKESTLK